ncbi:hypothetical protein BDV23DRAFT_157300 [Aspergillus alliaceus]|uniref:Uncharacterized protein n=1 Tax=Petromyces alliaceus TaxID=209559 RepID=A0A5N7C5F8_PETAA|nr:hypothetical protein BDV23DRAFT_157300 [Aspergillus alliaceus]
MGNIESIIRPDNPRRERQVRDLILDINSDLQFICEKSNDMISSMNQLLNSNFAQVVYDSHNPKQLIEDIKDRFTRIETLARHTYDNLDVGVDRPPLDKVIKDWGEGRSVGNISDMVDHFKDYGYTAEAAAIAASLAIFIVLGPTLTTMFGFMGTIAAGAISAIGGAIGYIVIGIISAEEKYHKLEEAITELTRTKNLLRENREKIANCADDLKLAIRLAQAQAKRG